MKKKVITALLTLFFFIFIFASFFYFIDNSKYRDTIHYGVYIAGVDISGLNRSDAAKMVMDAIDKKINKNVTIFYGKHKKIIGSDVIKPEVDVYSYVDLAYNINRRNNYLFNTLSSVALYFRPVNIEPYISFDEKAIIDAIDEFALKENIPVKDANLKIIEGKPIIEDEVIGLVIDVNKTYEKIIKALISEEMIDVKVECQADWLMPMLTRDQLVSVQKEMIEIVNGLSASTAGSNVEGKQIEGILNIESRKDVIFLSVNKRALNSFIDIQKEEWLEDPEETKFIENNPYISMEPGVPGVSSNKSSLLWDLKRDISAADEAEPKRIYKFVLPDFSGGEASNLGIFIMVSTHTEYFNPHQLNRVHNIRLLVKFLDGILLAPGEVFSFNETTGPRTIEKGFLLAPQIRNGRLVDAYGGGVCNVATTIFNTVFLGGYEIVDRKPHQFYISHYPAGRDATVDFGLVDFKFKNDTDSWILIKTSSTQSSVTVAFYSTDPDRIVRFETGKFTNYRPHTVEYVPDPNIPPGMQKKIEDGVSGCDITVTRYIVENGSKKIQEFFSRYYPKNTIILVNPSDMPDK